MVIGCLNLRSSRTLHHEASESATKEAPQHSETILSPETIKQFDEDGVVIIKGGMKEWISFAIQLVEDHEFLYENPQLIHDRNLSNLRWRESTGNRLLKRYRHYSSTLHKSSPGFQRLLTDSPVASMCAQLLHADRLRISFSALMDTPLKPGPGWHQDTGAVGPTQRHETIRFWLPLDACGHDGKGVNPFLLGSHRSSEILPGQQAPPPDFPCKFRQLVPDLEAGDLVIYAPSSVHRSPEPSASRRRVLSGTFCRADAVFDGGAENNCERFYLAFRNRRGQRLDDDIAPLVYPRQPEGPHAVAWGSVRCQKFNLRREAQQLRKDVAVPLMWQARKALATARHSFRRAA